MDIQEQLDGIERQALVAEKGYQVFSRMYAQTNPKPDPKPYISRIGMIRIALIVIMSASSIVSASHTIPTFSNSGEKDISQINIIVLLVGIAAFFMSEVALATFAYVGVMRHYRETEQEPASLKTLVKAGVIVPLVVMAAANINHEFSINGVILPQVLTSGIILAISLSAPFMGYISGEVFAMFEVIDRVDEGKQIASQNEQQERWEEKCRQAWGRSKGDYGGRIRVEPMPVRALSAVSAADRTGQDSGHGYGTGYTKQSNAREIIREHLRSNPDDMSMKVRDLADKIGQSKTTVGEVMKEMRMQDA